MNISLELGRSALARSDRKITVKCRCVTALAVVLAAQSTVALAEDAPQAIQSAATDSSEIIVTAQKRVDRISDVPMSIDAVTGDRLKTLGINSASQLLKVVPGFTYRESAAGVPSPAIRGIGFFDNSLGITPTVSSYIDEAPLPYSSMTRGTFLDLDRVEVLKGPQGTLYGQNSTGGAINYVSAKPTDTLSAGVDASYGRFNSVELEGFVSGPLTSTLSARVAGRIESRDDWQQSYTRSDSIGSKRFYNGRLLLAWTPSSSARFELNISGWRDKSDDLIPQYRLFNPLIKTGGYAPAYGLASYPVSPDDARAADWNPGQSYARNDSFFHTALRGDIDIASHIKLTSLTSYSDLQVRWPVDGDGTAVLNQSSVVDGRIRSFSQELRLAGDLGAGNTWLIGGNYQNDRLRERDNYIIHATASQFLGSNYNGLNVQADQRVNSLAAFGSFDAKLTGALTFQASARYTREHRSFIGCAADNGDNSLASIFSLLSTILTGAPKTIPAGQCVTLSDAGIAGLVRSRLNEDNFSWRAGINWKPSPDLLLYANATKGYKSGGYSTLLAPFAGQYQPATQESVLAYETGFKLSRGSNLQLSGAAFYLDYRDKQLIGTINLPGFGRNSALVNIPKSRVWGVELEATVRPFTGLRVTAGGTYVNSRVGSDPLAPVDSRGNPTSYIGNAFPDTPRWQAVGDTQYDFALTSRLNGFIGGNLQYRTGSFGSLGQSPVVSIDGYALLDLRAGIAAGDGRWRATLWGRNITNRYYWTNAFNSGDANLRFTGMPVTYGISFQQRF